MYRRGIYGSFYGIGLVDLMGCAEAALVVEVVHLFLNYTALFLLVIWLENRDGWITFRIARGVLVEYKVLTWYESLSEAGKSEEEEVISVSEMFW